MEWSDRDAENLLCQLLDIGEAMLADGAEVKRVEDTLIRMGCASGAVRMSVFVITSSMVVTMGLADGRKLTQTRRILSPGGTDFEKLEAFNALSRAYCKAPMPVSELAERVQSLKAETPSSRMLCLGNMLAAGSFALFFGGGPWDGVLAAAFAVLIFVLQRRLTPICPNKVIFNLLCALLTGMGICLCARLIPGLQADKIMIGDIMLLIPGIAMTNAVRDVLVGDTISGIMRLIETLLWAGSLACGFMIAIWLIGG